MSKSNPMHHQHPSKRIHMQPHQRAGNLAGQSFTGWDVYAEDGRWIDKVFTTKGSAYADDEVKRSLILHDGYDASIRVERDQS